jgi:cyanophycinase
VNGQLTKGCRTRTFLAKSNLIPTRALNRAFLPLTLATLLPLASGVRAAGPDGVARPGLGGRGALVIVGGGGLPDPIREKFLELAGGRKARLVVIPTANKKADLSVPIRSYLMWKAQKVASVTLLHTRDRNRANDPEFVKPLTEATGVWFTGGDQSKLIDAYRGTLVERELHRVLARGGVIGGTSAGAAVMSDPMIVGGNPRADVGHGFGFFTGVVVDQHFKERRRLDRLLGVLAGKARGCLGVGIDEATAVVVQGHSLTVLGRSGVSICVPGAGKKSPEVWRVLKPGQEADLFSVAVIPAAVARSVAAPPAAPKKGKESDAGGKRTTLSH